MDQPLPLRPAAAHEIEQALAHALRYDGSKAFRASGEMMAKITAAHLAEQLRRGGFVIMKAPAAVAHEAPTNAIAPGAIDAAAGATAGDATTGTAG